MFQDTANAFQVTNGDFIILDVVQCAGSAMDHKRIGRSLTHKIIFLFVNNIRGKSPG